MVQVTVDKRNLAVDVKILLSHVNILKSNENVDLCREALEWVGRKELSFWGILRRSRITLEAEEVEAEGVDKQCLGLIRMRIREEVRVRRVMRVRRGRWI